MENGWSDDAIRHDEPEVQRLVGARFHARPQDDGPGGPPAPGDRFPVVLRGYDRRRVDARMAELTAEVERLRVDAAEVHRRWLAAQEHATGLEAELRDRQDAPRRTDPGAAPIADRVLRHARLEAARIRAVALREADLLLARARQDAARERRSADEQGRAQAS
jgi:cell division septum initiation protein DivIVA